MKYSLLSPPIPMPHWLSELELRRKGARMDSPEEKIRFVIDVALENVRRRTGGPFAAAIFNRQNELCALGVNLVMNSKQSFAHAEMTAIANLQNQLRQTDLQSYLLASSCEPCVMCFGGILWAGLSEMIYGAPGSMPASIGFDEGDKVHDWKQSLEKRGIKVTGPFLEKEAFLPFQRYREQAGNIYGIPPSRQKENSR